MATNPRCRCLLLAALITAATAESAFQSNAFVLQHRCTGQSFRLLVPPIEPPPLSKQETRSSHPAAVFSSSSTRHDDRGARSGSIALAMSRSNGVRGERREGGGGSRGSVASSAAIFVVALLYWYLMVFGAAASSADLPVPGWLPLAPGWPPSDADLAPAVEDSVHFFYLADLIGYLSDAPPSDDGGAAGGAAAAAAVAVASQQPPVVRLAIFNFAEAWVFSFLPVLLADERKLPVPVVLGTWLGALGLTNAFLAPYLAFRELFASFGEGGDDDDDDVDVYADNDVSTKGMGGRSPLLSVGVGAVATAVVGYAALSSAVSSTPEQWADFGRLAAEDRTYLAFCVDLVLFSVFQPFLLRRVCGDSAEDGDGSFKPIYNVPFVGLMAWLFGI